MRERPADADATQHLRSLRQQQRLACGNASRSASRAAAHSAVRTVIRSRSPRRPPFWGSSSRARSWRSCPRSWRWGYSTSVSPAVSPPWPVDFVRYVSDVRQAGIETGIVSAAQWATSDAAAERMLAGLPSITCWDFIDRSLPPRQVPLENIERAFRLLAARGRPPLVRFAYHASGDQMTGGGVATAPFDAGDTAIVRSIDAFAGERISFQPVQPRGRGRVLPLRRKPSAPGEAPLLCMSEGLFVDEECRILPCGSLLAAERRPHSLLLGDASRDSLVEALQAWRSRPLLQLLRLGTLPRAVAHPSLGAPRRLEGDSDCERCVHLMRDTERVERLAGLLEEPATRAALERAHDDALAAQVDACDDVCSCMAS